MTDLAFLDSLMRDPIHVPKLGMRYHAILAGKAGSAAAAAILDGKHTCHCCAVRLPGGMEIDHIDRNHHNLSAGNLKPICQVCHYSRHPVWAAQHKRMRLIWMPHVSQLELNRLFWAAIMLSDASAAVEGEEDPKGLFEMLRINQDLLAQAAKAIPGLGEGGDLLEGVSLAVTSVLNDLLDDIETREMYCTRILGSANPESFVEGFFKVRDMVGPDKFSATFEFLKSGLRYWPEISGISWQFGLIVDRTEQLVDAAFAADGPLGLGTISQIVGAMGASMSTPEAGGDVSTG